jgi:transcriptional regulator with XRE-family HTH domain
MSEQPVNSFGMLLKHHRQAAGLTQEELAEAARLNAHTISDLERGYARKPHAETVRLLADALKLTGLAREQFEAAARRYNRARDSSATTTGAVDATLSAPLPRDPSAWLTYIVTKLDDAGEAAARSAVTLWKENRSVDSSWLAWVDEWITLTTEGRTSPVTRRPLPTVAGGLFLNRKQQSAELNDFMDRIQQGRGGLGLVLGPAGIGKSQLLAKVLADRMSSIQVEWVTLGRGEAGHRGWRRLLAPLWITLRRTELVPANLVSHTSTLDEILLTSSDNELAGSPFPGAVAAAIAAMLIHVAARKPLILVIDDAHRGGASSDHLLLDVARRVNAASVGLIAALRPDELEDDSPLRGYRDQPGSRAAADLVAPIRVPPLSLEATAGLIRERIGIEPPSEVVEQVLRKTGGCPQLIKCTEIQALRTSASVLSWSVGKLDAEGLRVLEDTIYARPEETRTVLYAAALYAADGRIEPSTIARITDMGDELVERILEKERRDGSILTLQINGYRFQHDNWIDALIDICPPPQQRRLHARCLELLRCDAAADPRQLARHAIGADALAADRELITLVREAADITLADYAFGAAAELYESAARYAVGVERIDLLIKQSDSLRFGGRWEEARRVLKQAAALARTLAVPGHEAMVIVHLERLIWSYGLHETELTQQIRDVIERLPPDEATLRAQARAALTTRLSISARQYENEQADLAWAALEELPSVTDRLARADIILGIRSGLQDIVPPEKLLEFGREVLDLALSLRSAFHLEEALAARVVDRIRAGRLLEVPSAVRAYRDFAEQSATTVAVYSRALIDAMLALAHGDFAAAAMHTAEAIRLSEHWGESMAREALMGQAGWLLYEQGQVDGLTEILADFFKQNVSSLNEPVWALAAGLIHAEKGEAEQAIRILREVCVNTCDLASLPRGPSRIGILAAAAMVLGHPTLSDTLSVDEATRWGNSIADLLVEHQDTLVVAGWPSVILGSKHRYIGLAYLAARKPAKAVDHLVRAVDENSDFAVLKARTRFDLARALIRLPGSYPQGVSEMERAEAQAVGLGMAGLATQAAAEKSRPSPSRNPHTSRDTAPDRPQATT